MPYNTDLFQKEILVVSRIFFLTKKEEKMSNTVNNNSEDINEIDMLKFIKNCLESVTINESHKRITEYGR